LKQKPPRTFPISPNVYNLFMEASCAQWHYMNLSTNYAGRKRAVRIIINGEAVRMRTTVAGGLSEGRISTTACALRKRTKQSLSLHRASWYHQSFSLNNRCNFY
jgi:hypothetical protein